MRPRWRRTDGHPRPPFWRMVGLGRHSLVENLLFYPRANQGPNALVIDQCAPALMAS